MFLGEQESGDTLVNLCARFLDGIHYEVVSDWNILLQLICLLNLCSGQLNESLTIEGMGLINSSINEQVLSIPLHTTGRDEADGSRLGSQLDKT